MHAQLLQRECSLQPGLLSKKRRIKLRNYFQLNACVQLWFRYNLFGCDDHQKWRAGDNAVAHDELGPGNRLTPLQFTPRYRLLPDLIHAVRCKPSTEAITLVLGRAPDSCENLRRLPESLFRNNGTAECHLWRRLSGSGQNVGADHRQSS